MTTDNSPAATPHDLLGGAPVFAAIANRFYDLMERDPAYAELRAMHAEDLGPMRESLPRFLAGWAGGPRDWFEANPGKCMMSLHKNFPIDRATAMQWAEAMARAVADVAPEPANVAQAMTDALTRMARSMAKPG
ncbi:hemoglobin [Novosphingobium sp. PhB165]|uniref:group II truncated hemoglobin n=1 Tax=Novosphingobium sp. PhB165 TaxID=2485105 RepID=UPI00104736FB|nr:group II truncated hemoglobin [Novosphingobium sp. PhB165]TCM18515.1 hemoglobin [Novosphingobium sp. PhB165]